MRCLLQWYILISENSAMCVPVKPKLHPSSATSHNMGFNDRMHERSCGKTKTLWGHNMKLHLKCEALLLLQYQCFQPNTCSPAAPLPFPNSFILPQWAQPYLWRQWEGRRLKRGLLLSWLCSSKLWPPQCTRAKQSCCAGGTRRFEGPKSSVDEMSCSHGPETFG